MKKIISFALLFLIILSSAVMAFAGEKNGRISVYASEEEVPSVLGSIKETKLNVSLNEHGITIDTETVMPIYYASIYDYAKSGEFSFVPHTLEEKQLYAADVISEDGEFAGVIMFTKDIMLMYMPSDSEADSVDFAGANSKRIESLTGEKTDSLIDKSLFAFVEGMGFVYYIDSGETKSFVSSNFNGSNGDIFTAENRGIIKIDDKLLNFLHVFVKRSENLNDLFHALRVDCSFHHNPVPLLSNLPVSAEQSFPDTSFSFPRYNSSHAASSSGPRTKSHPQPFQKVQMIVCMYPEEVEQTSEKEVLAVQ